MNSQFCKNSENDNTILVGAIRLNKKSRLKLTDEEITALDKFTKEDSTPYRTILENTRITRNTIVKIIERKWANAEHAMSLRLFIRNLLKEGIV